MTNNYQQTLADLDVESAKYESELARAEQIADTARTSLAAIAQARAALHTLLDPTSRGEGEAKEAPPAISSSELSPSTEDLTPRQRVIRALQTIGKPATKDEVFHALAETEEGLPQTWKNARNSFNNTFNRSVARGEIVHTRKDRFKLPDA